MKGSKEQWQDVCAHFANKGYVCATAGYRLVPQFRFPAQIEDVRLAIQHMKRESGRLGFDAGRIVAIGSSAGGHLTGMLGTMGADDPLGVSDELQDRETVPYAVIGYCPVVTMFDRRDTIANLLGYPLGEQEALYRMASPIERLRGGEPPFLLIHGDADQLIPLAQVQDFHDRLLRQGGRSRLVVLPGVDHGFGYGVQTEAQQAALAEVETFLSDLEKEK